MLTLDSSESIILSRKLRTFAYQLTKGETLGSSWNSPSPSSTYPVNHQVLNVLLFSQIAYSFPLPLILPYFRPSSALTSKNLWTFSSLLFLLLLISHDSIKQSPGPRMSKEALHHLPLLQNKRSQTCPHLNPWNLSMCYLPWQALCDLSGGKMILHYPAGFHVITGVLLRRRQEYQSRRDLKVFYCWLWRWWKGLWVREYRCPLEAGKDKEMESSLEKEHSHESALIFSPWDLFWTYDPQNWKIISLCCFKPLFVVICCSSNTKLIQ